MTQPSDGGEHEGENLKEVFGEPFNFIKLNLNVNGNSIGGKVVLYLVTEDLKGDLNLSEMPNVDGIISFFKGVDGFVSLHYLFLFLVWGDFFRIRDVNFTNFAGR